MRDHHRPATPGAGFFEDLTGGADPAEVREAGDLAATLLVRGVRDAAGADRVDRADGADRADGEDRDDRADRAAIAERVVHLADTEGLETLAEVWSGAPADTLAGCLWRLYLLRAWVHADPHRAAREYDAGRARAQVARVVAGVADPPGPDELRAMVDDVLRGIATGDFAVILLRAASFARVVATGRAGMVGVTHDETTRMLTLAEQLEACGHLEMRHALA